MNQTPHVHVPIDGMGRLNDDLPCVECGYNLRGADPEGGCPECGSGVRWSIEKAHQPTVWQHLRGWGPWAAKRAALFAVAGLVLVTLIEGRVVTVWFSTDTFETRSVTWWEVPWIELRVTPKRASAPTPTPVGEYLRQAGYLSRRVARDQSWDFMHGRRTGSHRWGGVARWSASHLAARNGEQLVAWSRAHPEKAKQLWPRVIRNVRDNAYLGRMTLDAVSDWVERSKYEARLFEDLEEDLTKWESELQFLVP